MLYYSNEARTSHISRIEELINIIYTTPIGNIGAYKDVHDIIKYLVEYKKAIEKEIKENE